MFLTISDIEADLQNERLTCEECKTQSRTLPAEGIPAQALRYSVDCGHVFFWTSQPGPIPPLNKKAARS